MLRPGSITQCRLDLVRIISQEKAQGVQKLMGIEG